MTKVNYVRNARRGWGSRTPTHIRRVGSHVPYASSAAGPYTLVKTYGNRAALLVYLPKRSGRRQTIMPASFQSNNKDPYPCRSRFSMLVPVPASLSPRANTSPCTSSSPCTSPSPGHLISTNPSVPIPVPRTILTPSSGPSPLCRSWSQFLCHHDVFGVRGVGFRCLCLCVSCPYLSL